MPQASIVPALLMLKTYSARCIEHSHIQTVSAVLLAAIKTAEAVMINFFMQLTPSQSRVLMI